MTFNRKQLAQLADWAAVAVAVALPWSTSATSILLVVWLITLIPTLDADVIWNLKRAFSAMSTLLATDVSRWRAAVLCVTAKLAADVA
jgi:hypothetical protein